MKREQRNRKKRMRNGNKTTQTRHSVFLNCKDGKVVEISKEKKELNIIMNVWKRKEEDDREKK